MGDKIRGQARVAERAACRPCPASREPGLRDDALDRGAERRRLPAADQALRRRRRQGHARRRVGGRARRRARRRAARGGVGVRRRHAVPRALRPTRATSRCRCSPTRTATSIHLGERECSLQRRHQKVIEEAPSPLLDDAHARAIGEAACETARSVGYRGAGTVEFIVSADRPDEFFFMEMNTRLQVEHPVTELVTGHRPRRAAAAHRRGRAARRSRRTTSRSTGHAIEARVYAEDPARGLPADRRPGRAASRIPSGDGMRVDTALEDGLVVSTDYDPMLAKVIAWGPDRDEARRRLVRALAETAVLGVDDERRVPAALLAQPAVVGGDLDTGLIDRELDGLAVRGGGCRGLRRSGAADRRSARTGADPWRRRDGWRLGPVASRRYALRPTAASSGRAGVGFGRRPAVAVDDGERPRGRPPPGPAHVPIAGIARSFCGPLSTGEVAFSRRGRAPDSIACRSRRRRDADERRPRFADAGDGRDGPGRGWGAGRGRRPGDRRRGHEDGTCGARGGRGTVSLRVPTGDQVVRGQTLATGRQPCPPSKRRAR